MSILLSAESAPVSSRLDYWRDALGRTLMPMEFQFDHGPDFHSRLVAGAVGPLRVVERHDGPGEVRRDARHIGKGPDGNYSVFGVVRGHEFTEHNGRATRLAPGDFSLLDLNQPFRHRHGERKVICMRFPRALLPLPDGDLRRVAGERIAGDRGTGALVSSLIRQLPRHLDDVGTQGARLGTAVIDLIAVALAARLGRPQAAPAESRQTALVHRVQAFIEQNLHSSELNPSMIAASQHISVRYLHRIFESTGTTVAGLIRDRRLERCRRDLLDPSRAGRPAGSIGVRWGFADAAHFNRAFRSRYGMPPGEYRRTGTDLADG